MTKHTAIIFLSVFMIFVALGGFPSWAHKTLLVLSSLGVAVLAYLSSVVYCSNCKKLIDDAENAMPSDHSPVLPDVSAPKAPEVTLPQPPANEFQP